MHGDDHDKFMDEYCRRSIIEAVFGAVKRMHGDHLKSHIVDYSQREIAVRIICHNIWLVAGSHVEGGRLDYEPLAAVAV